MQLENIGLLGKDKLDEFRIILIDIIQENEC